MALTGSKDINNYAINKYGEQFGENGTFRLITSEELKDPNNKKIKGLFSNTNDFEILTRTAKVFPQIHEVSLEGKEHFNELIEITINDKDSIPLFLKDISGDLQVVSSNGEQLNKIEKGWQMIYLGKPIILI